MERSWEYVCEKDRAGSIKEEEKRGRRVTLTLLTIGDRRMEPAKPGDPTEMGLKQAPYKQG